MFWKIMTTVLRTSVTLHRTATALGAVVFISVGVYDFVQKRRKNRIQ